MASSTATGLIMPKGVTGAQGGEGANEHPGYTPWRAGTTLTQPGPAEGDTNLLETDPVDDENLSSVEVGVIAVPAFPSGAGPLSSPAHAFQFSTNPRVGYIMNNSKYVGKVLPTALGDTSSGLLEPDDDEFYSDSASYAEHDLVQAAKEMRNAGSGAHQVNQIMSDTETSATGATGVWSIAGRV